jgi:hypothetical protein
MGLVYASDGVRSPFRIMELGIHDTRYSYEISAERDDHGNARMSGY